jgi:hypothetical protein
MLGGRHITLEVIRQICVMIRCLTIATRVNFVVKMIRQMEKMTSIQNVYFAKTCQTPLEGMTRITTNKPNASASTCMDASNQVCVVRSVLIFAIPLSILG